MGLSLGIIATLVGVAACGSDEPFNRPQAQTATDQPRPKAQELLDRAANHMKEAGTGSYTVKVPRIGTTMEGEFDLDRKSFRHEVTTRTPDFPDGFTVRGLTFKDEFFSRVSAGPASKCWMRYEADDVAAAHGIPGVDGSVQSSGLTATTPPAAEILKKPVARGYASPDSATEIIADVDVWSAFLAGMPKVGYALAKDYYEDYFTAPVTFTVVDGKYTGASYAAVDLLSSADITPAELKKAGLSEDVRPKFAFDQLAALEVTIKYGAFGQEVDILRPKKDEIADVNLATMGADDTISCEAGTD